MEKFNHPLDSLMDLLVTGLLAVREDQGDGRQQPPCTSGLPILDPSLLHASFDVSLCLPQTPFYDAPFTDMTLDKEIACSSDKELSHDSLLSSPSKSATPSPPLSRTLLSERRRRGSMKEMLFALRSLVPNITKMDKASIVGDAVIYVQQLKKEAKELTHEIAQLESRLHGGEACRLAEVHVPNPDNIAERKSGNRKIVKMDPSFRLLSEANAKILDDSRNPDFGSHTCPAWESLTAKMTLVDIEDCEFYLKITCYKAKGVVVGLLQVLESLEHVIVLSSNFVVDGEHINLTFTIHVGGSEDIDEAALKLSLLSKFADHGFYS